MTGDHLLATAIVKQIFLLPPSPGKFADVGGLIYGTAAFPELVFANDFQGKRSSCPFKPAVNSVSWSIATTPARKLKRRSSIESSVLACGASASTPSAS